MRSISPFRVALLLSLWLSPHLADALRLPQHRELEDDAASSFWQSEARAPVVKRARAEQTQTPTPTCGGDPALEQCGNDFPSTFCCGAESSCLLLNTTSTLTAALCCPAGQDCQLIHPVSCEEAMQNATAVPSSQLHSDPPTALGTCGSACCPMGYACQGGNCVALSASEVARSTTSISSLLGLPTPTPSISISTPATKAPASEALSTSSPLLDTKKSSHAAAFSPASFAAGFVPGIALGLLVAAAIILFLRRERQASNGSVDDKHRSGRDTLTDLSPDHDRRPTVHGRSISEPAVGTSAVHRTDFLNYSPPSQKSIRLDGATAGYVVEVTSPPRHSVSPQHATNEAPRQKGWFSRSPFVHQISTPKPTHSPLPSHLKRGTLSFQVSPVRALKKQRSLHSLRRHVTTGTNGSDGRRADSLARSQSTETIKVAMATPHQAPPQLPPTSFGRTRGERRARDDGNLRPQNVDAQPLTSRSWQTMTSGASSEESTPVDPEPSHPTPTRAGRNSTVATIGATLRSPSPPSTDGPGPSHPAPLHIVRHPHPHPHPHPHHFLSVRRATEQGPSHGVGGIFPARDGDSHWRDTRMTTWGSIMTKAGLTRSTLYEQAGDHGKLRGDVTCREGARD